VTLKDEEVARRCNDTLARFPMQAGALPAAWAWGALEAEAALGEGERVLIEGGHPV
jgi:hypothetical protein